MEENKCYFFLNLAFMDELMLFISKDLLRGYRIHQDQIPQLLILLKKDF